MATKMANAHTVGYWYRVTREVAARAPTRPPRGRASGVAGPASGPAVGEAQGHAVVEDVRGGPAPVVPGRPQSERNGHPNRRESGVRHAEKARLGRPCWGEDTIVPHEHPPMAFFWLQKPVKIKF